MLQTSDVVTKTQP